MTDALAVFSQAFAQASQHEPQVYANLLRFIGLVLAFLAAGFATTHFLNQEARAHDEFIAIMVLRLLKIMFGLLFIALLLKP